MAFIQKVYLYGFREDHKCVAFWYLESVKITVRNIRDRIRNFLKEAEISKVYMVDIRPGLKKDYEDSWKSLRYEDWLAFEDMINREGLLIYEVPSRANQDSVRTEQSNRSGVQSAESSGV